MSASPPSPASRGARIRRVGLLALHIFDLSLHTCTWDASALPGPLFATTHGLYEPSPPREVSLKMPPRRRARTATSDSEEWEPGSEDTRNVSARGKRARTTGDAGKACSDAPSGSDLDSEEEWSAKPGGPRARTSSSAPDRAKAKRKTKANGAKNRNKDKTRYALLETSMLGGQGTESGEQCTPPPERTHAVGYHAPLLDGDGTLGREARAGLLAWYASVKTVRAMPWREPWLDPSEAGWDERVGERAYRVWLSEIMLQQTRVATVVDYWTRWVERWPTLGALAAASRDDVLAQWKGLGYYSRATRIHEAAQLVVSAHDGRLPASAAALRAVPGIGPYTAGAVSSIVYGHPEAVLDGNVVRVLTRQLGLRAPVADKPVVDILWGVAARLVAHAAADHGSTPSYVPGDWNQAIMELGSTLCMPLNPDCGRCPIRATCRAYAEGVTIRAEQPKPQATSQTLTEPDIEDLCTACEPLEEDLFLAAIEPKGTKGPKGNPPTRASARAKGKVTSWRKSARTAKQTMLSFAPVNTTPKPDPESEAEFTVKSEPASDTGGESVLVDADALSLARVYAQFFPLKKKEGPRPTRAAAVCIVRGPRGYALEQRPARGLLASMWQFPTLEAWAPDAESGGEEVRAVGVEAVSTFVAGVAEAMGTATAPRAVRLCRRLGEVVHVFSHFTFVMHVFVYEIDDDGAAGREQGAVPEGPAVAALARRWATKDEVEASTMGTGMVNVFKRYRQSL